MRIIAGEWRGRPLVTPAGRATRPTSDRAREGLFSMLTSRIGSFEGLRVADMFAGSGALGLEALSRGAAHCTFVDSDRSAISAIEFNLNAFVGAARADLRCQSVEHASPPPQPCDLIFLDPPYSSDLAALALTRLAQPGWLSPGAVVSVETDRSLPPSAPFELETQRRFGKAWIHLLRARC